MCKIVLCLAMFVTNLSIYDDITQVKQIEYTAKELEEDVINMKVRIYSSKKDLIELRVFFDNKQSDFFSSVLEVEGELNTIAKIPILDNDIALLALIFYSHNLNEIIKKIDLPVYYVKKDICRLSEEKLCISSTPVKVLYDGEYIKEEYEKIALINNESNYFTFNNLFPIDKIKVSSSLIEDGGYANLFVEGKICLKEINDYNGCSFPLEVTYNRGILDFKFYNNYYLDMVQGRTYESYKSNTVYTNNIVFPYEDKEYKISIILENVFISFEKVSLDFVLKTKGFLIGDCIDSKYCLRRVYL